MSKIKNYLKEYFGDKFQYYMMSPHFVKELDFEDVILEDIKEITMFSNLTYLNVSGIERNLC